MRRVALGILAVVLLAACGNAPVDEIAVVVPDGVVPATLTSGDLKLAENVEEATREVFATLENSALIHDGRIWEIRKGERLVGVVQVSVAKERLDLANEEQRNQIIGEVIPSTPATLTVEDTTIYSASTNRKAVYLWFGETMFTIAQFSLDDIDPEKALQELVRFQVTDNKVFSPLPTEPSAQQSETS